MADEEKESAAPSDEELVEDIVECWSSWKDARLDKELKIQSCVNNYLTYIDESKFESWPWRCKVSDTFSQETGDTISSALKNGLFPLDEDFIDLIGEDDLGVQYAQPMKRYVLQHWNRLKFLERIAPAIKQLAVTGNSPVLSPWHEQMITRRKRTRELDVRTGKTTVSVKDVSRSLYSGPGLDVLDFFDVVYDPSQLGWPSSAKIRRSVIPKELAKQHYPKFDWSQLDEAHGKPSEPSDVLKSQRAQVFGFIDATADNSALGDEEQEDGIEILEMYGDCLLCNRLYKDWQCTVINRKYLVESKRNEYWGGSPLFVGTYDQLWFTPFGRGPLEPILGTQELIDTFTNQKADNLNLALNMAHFYQDDGIFDPETAQLRPGAWIELGNIANVRPVTTGVNFTVAFQEIELLRARGERSSSASRMNMGQVSGGRRTAYEASLVNQGGSGRQMDTLMHIANTFMEPICQFHVECIQQFKWDAKDRPSDLPQEALLGTYRVQYTGANTTAMRQFELQGFTQFLDILGRIPSLAMALNPPELLGDLVRLFKLRNTKIVKTKDEYEAEVARQQAQQQAQQQGGGMPGEGEMGPGMPQSVDQEMAAMLGSPMG